MPVNRRRKLVNWNVMDSSGTVILDRPNGVLLAVLLDIREELQAMNVQLIPLRNLGCANFLRIPRKLDRISRNTAKPRKPRA